MFKSIAVRGKRFAYFALLGSVLAGGALGAWGCSDMPDEPNLAVVVSEIQSVYVGTTETTKSYGVNLLRGLSLSRKGKSTGAIRATWTTGDKGNCGVTFISHTYGVTAAHCVPSSQFQIGVTTFRVEHMDTSNLNMTAFTAQQQVDGIWPTWQRPRKLSGADGYILTSVNCTVAKRCAHGAANCPFPQLVDTALIHCPNRPKTGLNWVPVRSTDPQNLNVEVYWFHEVLNLSADGYDHIYQPVGNASNYMFKTGSNTNNYHYWHGFPDTDHDMLPLRSRWAVGGTAYRALGGDGTYTNTNVPACHGTSGSGVFPQNENALLGNVNHGGWASNELCARTLASGPQSTWQSDYVATSYVRQLQTSEVTMDRAP